jgi:hypothetical protein
VVRELRHRHAGRGVDRVGRDHVEPDLGDRRIALVARSARAVAKTREAARSKMVRTPIGSRAVWAAADTPGPRDPPGSEPLARRPRIARGGARGAR